jgi:hypothetical protein
LPHRGPGAAERLFTFNELHFAETHRFTAAADFIQMGALNRGVGFASETCEELFDQLGPAGTWQTKGI